MPSQRVYEYWREPVGKDFEHHMICETDLSEEDQKLCWDMRKGCYGNTEYYAEKAKMPVKLYTERVRHIFRRVMPELIRLAEIGYRYERSQRKA